MSSRGLRMMALPSKKLREKQQAVKMQRVADYLQTNRPIPDDVIENSDGPDEDTILFDLKAYNRDGSFHGIPAETFQVNVLPVISE